MPRLPLPDHPTPDELEAAWREVHEPGWPTVAELQRHLAHYHQVRAAALRRRSTPLTQPASAPAYAWPPRRAHAPAPAFAGLDAKRLAAGERPDPDDDSPA